MQPLIAIDALTIAFRGVKVLDGVSLEVRRGEAIASSASPAPASR